MSLTSTSLSTSLSALLPRSGAVQTSSFARVIAAVDASHYLLTPSAVVIPSGVSEVADIFRFASKGGYAITFRSGGTSLSGQASTANILVDTRSQFRRIDVEQGGTVARVQPGATVRQVNTRLARHSRKLGPDPASEIACTIGGVVANNSSGMACGTAHNTYNTLRSMVAVLPSGTIVDTGLDDADEQLRLAEPELCTTLLGLRERILSSPLLRAEIERQFQIKNTMGYSLNALVDYATPAQILSHLMVGSEGTLGFVAEATFNTVPLLPHAATTLLVFDSLHEATASLMELMTTAPATIELMDAASLRAAARDNESREALPNITIVDHCALLVEYQAPDEGRLDEMVEKASEVFSQFSLAIAPQLTRDAGVRASLWHIRKGIYATVAGARPSGTTALLEDIAVPVSTLSATCARLIQLFDLHGYHDAVIFGHAKDGNIHFLVNEDFERPSNLKRYRAFTEDLVELVLSAGGTLKAEHGTGRIMAPFVKRQYGADLYQVMLDIKRAFDPVGILNPDVLLTTDADLHLKYLKSTPSVESEVDGCVECGYCEPACPSKDLTTTPRQRIVVRRAIAEATATHNKKLARELTRAQAYEVIDTCAVDGMCQTACPVNINTGDLVRHLRAENVGAVDSAVWNTAARAWGPVSGIVSTVLTALRRLPPGLVNVLNRFARAVLGHDTVPQWSVDLPAGGAKRGARSRTATASTPAIETLPAASVITDSPDAVYFQACVGSMFGPAEGHGGVARAFESLASKAGLTLTRPDDIAGLCCGTPWKSKGIESAYSTMIDRTIEALWNVSEGGRLPVVCDNSSCSEGLVAALTSAIERDSRRSSLTIIDAVDFVATRVIPHVVVDAKLASIAVHPTCSSTRAGSNANLRMLCEVLATNVVVPDNWGCCAFAGDRGMLHPELTASATRSEAAEVNAADVNAYVSCNRTCEIGMSRATGHTYVHVLETLDFLSRSRENRTAQPATARKN